VPVVALDDVAEPHLLQAERQEAVVEPGRLAEAVADVATSATLVVVGAEAGHRQASERLAERLIFGVRSSVLVVRAGAPAAA
jgi:hypothetical protein